MNRWRTGARDAFDDKRIDLNVAESQYSISFAIVYSIKTCVKRAGIKSHLQRFGFKFRNIVEGSASVCTMPYENLLIEIEDAVTAVVFGSDRGFCAEHHP